MKRIASYYLDFGNPHKSGSLSAHLISKHRNKQTLHRKTVQTNHEATIKGTMMNKVYHEVNLDNRVKSFVSTTVCTFSIDYNNNGYI